VGGWMTVFSPNDISGLRRPKNVKLIVAKFLPENRQTIKNAYFFSTHTVVPHISTNTVYMAPSY